MRRPLGLSAAGWFLVASGLIPVLLLLMPATPTSPQVAALVTAMPPDGWFPDAIWWTDAVIAVTGGVLVLKGVRAGRVLYLAWGAVSLALLARTLTVQAGVAQAAAQQIQAFAIATALLHVAIYLAVAFLLLRRPSRNWFALPPDQRSFPVWSVRGVFGAVLLVAGGFALYCWLLICLICVAVAIDQGLKPFMVVMLVVWLVPVAAFLALGLAVAPGRQGKRRLAVVGLCSGLFTLFIGVMGGTILCSPVALSLLPPAQVPAGFGPRLLLACPVLLVLLVPCAIHLRRSSPARVAAPG